MKLLLGRTRAARGLIGLGLCLSLSLGQRAACAAAPASAASGPPAAGAANAGTAPDTALRPCRLHDLPHTAWCGSLQRALDPARPQGVQIEVHYAVLPALARHKAVDPVFFFAGGPGQSAINLAGALAGRYARLGQRRDLVFVDLRGTGRSAPLRCADDDDRAVLQPLAERADETLRRQRLQACRLALQALPYGDLRFFTTSLAVADVDAVRQALGVGRLNAIGGSYGTRAVLELMRQFPATVRRAVLDGVAPPDMRLPDAAARDNQAALDGLLAACNAEPACARAHPALRAQTLTVLQNLPLQVLLPHPLTGRPEPVRLQRETVLGMLRAPLYAPALAAGLPAAVAEAAAGRWAPLAALASAVGGAGGGLATGLHFSVVCAEDLGPNAPPADPADGAAALDSENVFGASFAQLYRQVCADWQRGAVAPAFYNMPPATAPVWLLSGGLDPVTPPRHGQRAALALGARARHSVVDNAGHGVTGLGCVRDAVARFISTDDDQASLGVAATGADCAATVPRARVFVPPGLRSGLAPSRPPAPAVPTGAAR